jgi:hypothetical protein
MGLVGLRREIQMSRSYKKNNKGWVCSCNNGAMKEWKSQMNRNLRKIPIDEEIGNGAIYKRRSEIWASPSDGKCWFDEPKFKRK